MMLSLLYQRRKRKNQPKLSATTSQSPALLPPNQAKTPDFCSSRRCKTSKVNRQSRGRDRRCNLSSRWTCLCTLISSLKYSTKPLLPRSTPVRNWDDLRRSSHAKQKRSQIAERWLSVLTACLMSCPLAPITTRRDCNLPLSLTQLLKEGLVWHQLCRPIWVNQSNSYKGNKRRLWLKNLIWKMTRKNWHDS